jgi:hypothetical protein
MTMDANANGDTNTSLIYIDKYSNENYLMHMINN